MKASEMMKGRWKRTALAVVLAAGLVVPSGLVASAATPEDGTDFVEEVLDTDVELDEGVESNEDENSASGEFGVTPQNGTDESGDVSAENGDTEKPSGEETEDAGDESLIEDETTDSTGAAGKLLDDRIEGEVLSSSENADSDQPAAEPQVDKTCTVTFGDYGSVTVPKGSTLAASQIPQPPATTVRVSIYEEGDGGDMEAEFYGWVRGYVAVDSGRYTLKTPLGDNKFFTGFPSRDGSQQFFTWSNYVSQFGASDLMLSPSESIEKDETLVAVYAIKASLVDVYVFKTREGAHPTEDVFPVEIPDGASRDEVEVIIKRAAERQIATYNRIWSEQGYVGRWVSEGFYSGKEEGGNRPYDFKEFGSEEVWLRLVWVADSAGDESASAPVVPSGSASSPGLGFQVVGGGGVTIKGHLSGPNVPDGADVKITADEVSSGSAFDLLKLAVGTKLFGGVFEVDLTVNGKLVHDGFGSLTISFPVPENLKGASKMRVWHLHEDGRITWEDVAPKDGAATVTVTDLSTFALSAAGEEGEPEDKPKDVPPATSIPETGTDANLAQTGDEAGSNAIPAALACAITLAAAAIARRRITGSR